MRDVVDVQQCRTQKKSIFTPLKQTKTQESFDMVMSLYEEFELVADDLRGSDYVIVDSDSLRMPLLGRSVCRRAFLARSRRRDLMHLGTELEEG